MATLTLADRDTLRHEVVNLIADKRLKVEPLDYNAARWLETFESVLGDASAVRMSAKRAFQTMAARGRKVKTLQFVVNKTLDTTSSWWSPNVSRKVEARATFVLFDGSRRDYEGETVLAANEDVTAVISRWGENFMIAIYLTV